MDKTLADLSEEMTGGMSNDPFEAFQQWEMERQALSELYDENQAYSIRNRRLWIGLQLAKKTLMAVEAEAAMFITSKSRDVIQKFNEQYEILDRAHVLDLDLNESTNNHSGPFVGRG